MKSIFIEIYLSGRVMEQYEKEVYKSAYKTVKH